MPATDSAPDVQPARHRDDSHALNPAQPVARSRSRYRRLVQLGLIILLVAAPTSLAINLWPEQPKNFAAVESGLFYRSGQIQASLIRDVLEDHQICLVINLGEDKDKPDHIAEIQAARELGIERHTLYLLGDGTGDIENYAKAIAHLHRARLAGQPALVHCSAGRQRTSAAVAFYQLLVQNKPLEEVRQHMLQFHDPKDNPVLIPYMNEHMEELARLLVQYGVIPSVPANIPQITLD
jgi:hypothetical protein